MVGKRNPPHHAPPRLPAANIITMWDMERTNQLSDQQRGPIWGDILKWSREDDLVHVPMVRATFTVRRREFSSPAMAEDSGVVNGCSGTPQSK
jgi:hypothetical protein